MQDFMGADFHSQFLQPCVLCGCDKVCMFDFLICYFINARPFWLLNTQVIINMIRQCSTRFNWRPPISIFRAMVSFSVFEKFPYRRICIFAFPNHRTLIWGVIGNEVTFLRKLTYVICISLIFVMEPIPSSKMVP